MTKSASLGGVAVRLAQAFGINAVPLAGYFGAGWSAGTALAVYWVESMFVIAFMSARIALHRHLTRKAGHFRPPSWLRAPGDPVPEVGSGSLLGGYLGMALFFTLAHGIFLAVLLLLVLPEELGTMAAIGPADLGRGAVGVIAFVVLGFVIDTVSLRKRSFGWIEQLTALAMGRILVVHLTIVLGMGTFLFFGAPGAVFALFALLKTLVDVTTVIQQSKNETNTALPTVHLSERPGDAMSSCQGQDAPSALLTGSVAEREANERVLDR
jgi:hypothetical protein